MNTTDYYAQQIQRLEADRAFWMGCDKINQRKIAQLEADLEKAREELRVMNKWAGVDTIEVEISGYTLFADTSPDGTLMGLYCKPGENIEGLMDIKQMDSICCQIEDDFANRED